MLICNKYRLNPILKDFFDWYIVKSNEKNIFIESYLVENNNFFLEKISNNLKKDIIKLYSFEIFDVFKNRICNYVSCISKETIEDLTIEEYEKLNLNIQKQWKIFSKILKIEHLTIKWMKNESINKFKLIETKKD